MDKEDKVREVEGVAARGKWGSGGPEEEKSGWGQEKKLRHQDLGGARLKGELGLVVKDGVWEESLGKDKVDNNGVKGKRVGGHGVGHQRCRCGPGRMGTGWRGNPAASNTVT